MTNQPGLNDLNISIDLSELLSKRTRGERTTEPPRMPGKDFITENMAWHARQKAGKAMYVAFPFKTDPERTWEELSFKAQLWWTNFAKVCVDEYNAELNRKW